MLIGGLEYTATSHLEFACPCAQCIVIKWHDCFCASCFPLTERTCSERNEAEDHFPDWRLLNMSEMNQEKAGNSNLPLN